MFRVKRLFLLLALFAVGCVPAMKTPVNAVYLVRDIGQLAREDLQAYPEVIVTDNFDSLKDIAQTKVAIWIDINAVDLVDLEWLGQSPQALYPVVLVGNGDEMCSFFNTVHYTLPLRFHVVWNAVPLHQDLA